MAGLPSRLHLYYSEGKRPFDVTVPCTLNLMWVAGRETGVLELLKGAIIRDYLFFRACTRSSSIMSPGAFVCIFSPNLKRVYPPLLSAEKLASGMCGAHDTLGQIYTGFNTCQGKIFHAIFVIMHEAVFPRKVKRPFPSGLFRPRRGN